MKLAFFVHPHLGGTFTVFRHLRAGLSPLGFEVQWMGIGPLAHASARDPDWQTERESGAVCGGPGDEEPTLARALLAALADGGFDGVFINVHADPVQTNLACHLPSDLLRILIVHNITPGTYAAASAIRDHVHATVCVSPRIEADLILYHRFRPDRICTILNATDQAPAPREADIGSRPLRLLSLGRVEDQAKGILWVPDIFRRLPGDLRLTVAGDGPDLARLRKRCAWMGERVRFTGAVSAQAVSTLMADHDILLAPSRFEGFMITAVEAMAAGCVPVVSHIRGVTDCVVESGGTGLLFPVGDVRAAAEAVRRLIDQPALRRAMADRGRRQVEDRFMVRRLAADYAALLDRVLAARPAIARPFPIEAWRLPPGLRPGLRSHLPVPLKNLLRGIRERGEIRNRTAERVR